MLLLILHTLGQQKPTTVTIDARFQEDCTFVHAKLDFIYTMNLSIRFCMLMFLPICPMPVLSIGSLILNYIEIKHKIKSFQVLRSHKENNKKATKSSRHIQIYVRPFKLISKTLILISNKIVIKYRINGWSN